MFFFHAVIAVILHHFIAITQSNCPKCQTKLDLSVCYSIDKVSEAIVPAECHAESVCHKNFTISFIELKPYTTEIVADLLRRCCGNNINVTQPLHTWTTVTQIPSPKTSDSHFIFPVLGRMNSKDMFEYKFIPLVEAPNIYFVCNRQEELMQQLIFSCGSMWPLIVICFLMTIISGFICWLIETWNNREEFPRGFLKGWFEGFWWSYISVTTVGYGDKAPRSAIARLFSVIWIFIGITIFTLVTAMLTAEITKYNSLPPPTMTGAHVGVIRYRLYESILVASHGGILIDIKSQNITDGIIQLVEMLANKTIDGFVLDTYSMLVFQRHFSIDPRYQQVLKYIHTRTSRTEFLYSPNKYAYGVLVRDWEDYDFLKDFVANNHDVIHTCNNLLINNYSSHGKVNRVTHPLFATEGKLFWPLFVALVVMIFAIFCFGFSYELIQGRRYQGRVLCNVKEFVMKKDENLD